MFWKSLQWRLVFIFISITLVLILSISVVLYVFVQSKFYEVFRSSIVTGFEELDINLEEQGYKLQQLNLDQLKNFLSNKVDGKNGAAVYFSISGQHKRYMIINKKTNEVIESSDDRFSTGYNYDIMSSTNLLNVLANNQIGDENKPLVIGEEAYFDYAKYIPLADGEYVLYFMNDKKQWQDVINELNQIIMVAAIIAIFVSVVLGYVFARTITVPITNVMKKAQLIAAGDFDQLLHVKSDDEIGNLTETFNIMAKELKKNLLEISSEKNKIETILNYMTDGVIAFNADGAVIHANPAAKMMLEFRDLYDSFDEFSKKYGLNTNLNDIIDNIIQENPVDNKENYITLDDDKKIYRVYYAAITSNRREFEGLIVVLQDVTEQQKLENMRKEFVANVSHELKTPLTSIKSYAETLIEGDINDLDTEKRFLGVIESEADRMARLVRDLLQLSSFDNQKASWAMKDTSLVNIILRVVEKMAIEAKTKNHTINCKMPDEFPDMYIDEDRMEQVILNILSNAIKYTPNNGTIDIVLKKEYTNAVMSFKDTGIGIPKKDIKRIFERFYRVDKARSREMGGTGLGLSIAKEIIEYHDGNIRVESDTGEGTEVIISLPL